MDDTERIDWSYGIVCFVIFTLIMVLSALVMWLVVYCLLKHCKKEFRKPNHLKLRPNHEPDPTILVDPLRNSDSTILVDPLRNSDPTILVDPLRNSDSTILVDPLRNEQFENMPMDGVHDSKEPQLLFTECIPKSRITSTSLTRV